jgi:uncharacterized protein (DUF1684 family)
MFSNEDFVPATICTLQRKIFHNGYDMNCRSLRNPLASSSFFIFTWILFLIASQGCSTNKPSDRTAQERQNPIIQERLARDAAFKSGNDSPLLPQNKARFSGLSYFPINPGLRFSVMLRRYPRPQEIRLGTNTGEIRSALRYGFFEFQAEARTCRLQVFRLEDSPDRGPFLFVPFRDSTSGQETYGAGRYIDLQENTTGVYDLDFNRAYNPSCAYNSTFSCPIPPAENTLQIPIRAGERKYSLEH